MSRGIGKTQRAILDALEVDPDTPQTIKELAATVGISERQCLRACTSLQDRRLLIMRKWGKGCGYSDKARPVFAHAGELPRSYRYAKNPPAPIGHLDKGDPWPGKPGYVASAPTDIYPGILPYGWAWAVWHESHIEKFEKENAHWASVRMMMRGYA